VVFSRTGAPAGPDEPTNPEAIARHGEVAILGTMPPIASRDPATLAAAAETHLADALAQIQPRQR
jgi:hypothetical protein